MLMMIRNLFVCPVKIINFYNLRMTKSKMATK